MSYLDIIDEIDEIQRHLTALSGIADAQSYSVRPYDIVDEQGVSLIQEYICDALAYEAGRLKNIMEDMKEEHKKISC